MLRLIIQTKRKYKKKFEEDLGDTPMNREKEDRTNDECDQDSSISLENDTESTSSQEEELEDWTEIFLKKKEKKAQEKLMRKC